MGEKMLAIKQYIKSWIEWRNAIEWAKFCHPSWVQLATQRKRPEIRDTYRKKILNEYHKTY